MKSISYADGAGGRCHDSPSEMHALFKTRTPSNSVEKIASFATNWRHLLELHRHRFRNDICASAEQLSTNRIADYIVNISYASREHGRSISVALSEASEE